MIVIMGATGNIGSKLSKMLLDDGAMVKALGRSEDRLKSVADLGAETAVGDVSDAAFLLEAFQGAQALFAMIPPAYSVDDFRGYYNGIGTHIARAIEASGIRHVVFLSSIGADLAEKTGPIKGLHDVEQKLRLLDGINILFLRPTYFMENLLANIDVINNMGIIGSSIKGDRKFAMIATKDIAMAAAGYLLKRDFTGKGVHELLGERDVSMDEVTRILGNRIGLPDLEYVQFSVEVEKKGMQAAGFSADASDQMVELNQAINDGIIAVNVPRSVDNTTATRIEDFADFFAQVYELS